MIHLTIRLSAASSKPVGLTVGLLPLMNSYEGRSYNQGKSAACHLSCDKETLSETNGYWVTPSAFQYASGPIRAQMDMETKTVLHKGTKRVTLHNSLPKHQTSHY